jgi:hypothetical protein
MPEFLKAKTWPCAVLDNSWVQSSRDTNHNPYIGDGV